MLKILAINGSHRKGKNTAAMLNLVLEEARAGGAEAELLEITDYTIKPCSSCNGCLRRLSCSIQDDMQVIAEKMLGADAIIIGSPVYFGNVTGLLKVFMDRTRWLHMVENTLDGKIGAAVTMAALRNGGQETTHLLIERFLHGHGLVVVDSRDPKGGVYNLGAIGSLYTELEGDQIHWKRGVLEDRLAERECRQLGRNVLVTFAKRKS